MTQVCRQLFLAQKVNRTLSYQKTLRLKRVDCGRTVTVVRHRHLANGSALLIANHGLRGSASPVLTATGFVNGRWQFSTPHRIHTP